MRQLRHRIGASSKTRRMASMIPEGRDARVLLQPQREHVNMKSGYLVYFYLDFMPPTEFRTLAMKFRSWSGPSRPFVSSDKPCAVAHSLLPMSSTRCPSPLPETRAPHGSKLAWRD